MGDTEITKLNQRVALIEQDVEGERGVSRHILRKLTETEAAMLGHRGETAEMRKSLSERLTAVENQLVTLRADLPRIIADAVGAVLRGQA